MRYSDIDLQCEDIMWFGLDNNGYVVAFTSGGCGNVPEFVCRSREETEMLEDYFTGDLNHISEGILEIDFSNGFLAEDALALANKGIYSFDACFDEGHTDEYIRIAYPHIPLTTDTLPIQIRGAMETHRIDFDASKTEYVHIQHAY